MDFGDQDLRSVFNRALRNVIIATALGIPIVWFAWGWRSMVLFLVGAAIAATGILEWRQLTGAVLVRLDAGQDSDSSTTGSPRRPIGPTLLWFFIRLVAAAGLLYVSLRSLDGKVAAPILGISLALVALVIEAIRLFRGWTA